MLRNTHFTVVDVETTGGRAGRDRIIEIGAVKVRAGRVVDTFETLINPGCDIPPVITWLTGISSRMVSRSPSFFEVADRFWGFLRDSVFVAHNAHFDFTFVNTEFILADYGTLNNPILCTVKLARRTFPGLLHYNLSDLCRTLKIPLARAHRAGEDSLATAHLLIRIMKKLAACGIEDLEKFQLFYEQSPKECELMLDRAAIR